MSVCDIEHGHECVCVCVCVCVGAVYAGAPSLSMCSVHLSDCD